MKPNKTIIRFSSEYLILTAIVLLSGFLSSCNKNADSPDPAVGEKTMDQLVVARNFDWATTKDISFTIIARDNMDNPLANVRFKVYSASPDSGGVFMFGGVTDESGVWASVQPVPAYMSVITITNDFIGLIREQRLAVQGNVVTGIFGGLAPKPVVLKSSPGIMKSTLTGIYYMGTYNSLGVPDYLEPVNDPIDASLLNDLNAALPERSPVPVYHPQYLANTAPNNLALNELCDVWVTYVTEGAGWRNSVGFFTFDTDSPPATSSAIDSIKIVFPNLSNVGENSYGTGFTGGGGLYPGNKVYLGRFPAGKSIGWVVIANGWNGSQVTTGNHMVYSIPALNPETNPQLKKHTVLLRDPGRHDIIFSFEDRRRDDAACDQDFNDGILYVKANPVTAIETGGMPDMPTTQPDQDGDGVADVFDDYPDDPTKAFDNWYPGETTYSSLAFEDLWPGKGDYDFNDLVLSYRFNQITNAQNKVVQVKAVLIPEAMGASLHNAFGFQMPIDPASIASVTGIDLRHGLINVAANNTETGQSKAVIIAFDDAYDHLPSTGGTGSNTEPGRPYVTPDTLRLTIDLSSPVEQSLIGTPPYNPFIIVDQNRNREVHLPDQPPTDKVDGSDFGTQNDDSQPLSGRYYKTANNLPWAINISTKFQYVIERIPINTAFLKFNFWAESAGVQNPDWYSNTASGYRDVSKIYTHTAR
jgi:LruC domain-containing protein